MLQSIKSEELQENNTVYNQELQEQSWQWSYTTEDSMNSVTNM